MNCLSRTINDSDVAEFGLHVYFPAQNSQKLVTITGIHRNVGLRGWILPFVVNLYMVTPKYSPESTYKLTSEIFLLFSLVF